MKTPPLRGLAALASAAALRTTAAFAPSSLPSRGPPSRSQSNAPPPRRRGPSLLHRRTSAALRASSSDPEDDGDGAASCWNPDLRRRLAALSSLGLLETSYLTYDKLSGGGPDSLVGALCSAAAEDGASSCGDVLRGPYASLHVGGADVPLAAVGAVAYGAVLLLSALPLLSSNSETSGGGGGGALDGGNRVALLGATTLVASFSAYLVSLLVGVLHADCAFCLASAGISASLAALSWTSDMLPEAAAGDDAAAGLRRSGVLAGASSVGAATIAALVLFVGAGDVGADSASLAASSASNNSAGANGGTLLASAAAAAPPAKSYAANVPPRITTRSTPYALSLAADLRALDARMYGAFWCSHCYDQKQSLGAEAMRSVPYVECDGEGYQNQRQTCKEKEVPGYPTWEIGGRLFPGERSLEELREIVDDVKAGR